MPISFAQAKTVRTAKAKKAAPAEIVIPGLEKLAAIDSVIKSLTALRAIYDSEAKIAMTDHFIEVGCESKERPKNFRGTEGVAEASCQLRVRSSGTVLSAEEQALATEFEIPTTKVESVMETYIFNPAYINDQAKMAKIEKALNGIKGIPDDLILKQEGVSKVVLAEGAVDAIFKNDEEVARRLLPLVGVLSITPKINDVDFANKLVRELIGENDEAVAA